MTELKNGIDKMIPITKGDYKTEKQMKCWGLMFNYNNRKFNSLFSNLHNSYNLHSNQHHNHSYLNSNNNS